MNIINTVLGTPLGYIIYFAYRLTESYGLAILIFAVAVRVVILFPINILAHTNSIRLLKLQPGLGVIKRQYAGDKERLNEEQYNLFKKERYSPFVGLIPLFAQLILIIGIMQVMLNPMRHMHGIAAGEIDFIFLGLNLLAVPSFANPSPELIMPLLSVASALAFCLVQNAISPGAISQSKGTNLGLTIFTVTLSLYLTLVLPVGVGLYWTVSNLLGVGVILMLNLMYSPKKLAPEALAYLKSTRKTPEEQKTERELTKGLKLREKHDIARFVAAKKKLVFYALTGGQYKYYKNVIEYILGNSDIVIHYLTNDPDDALFGQENEKLIPYYASQQKTISLMLKLDADILVTTVPDLQSYHMKRSIVRDDIEYIYIQHTVASVHLTLREKSLDYFDTIFCVGSHQVNELRRRETLAGLAQRRLIKAGYGVYDQLIEAYAVISQTVNEKPKILIAPSWQSDNILDLCIDDILGSLLGKGYSITVRPHPQYIRLYPERMKDLTERYSHYTAYGELVFELDFAGNQSIFTSDVLLTDWSNIAFEFSYCTLKPTLFINTPMKIMNPKYEQYGLEVLDISLRDKVGVSVGVDRLKNLDEAVAKLLAEKDAYREQIKQVVAQYLFHPERNGEAGGKYIIKAIEAKATR